MDPYKQYEDFMKEREKERERYENMTDEEKKIIEDKKEEMSKKVFELLMLNKIDIIDIGSFFSGNRLLRDNVTKKDAIATTFYEPLFPDRMITVVTDFETMEMLYVRTGVGSYVDIDEFFPIKE